MTRAKHILLIDDNDVDNFIAEHMMKTKNMADIITVKRSAVQALDFLNHQVNEMGLFPNFILLDINMPQMDGFDFLKEFAKFPEHIKKQCSIIMLTSSEDLNDKTKAMHNPYVKKYLLKPLSGYEITEVLNY